jgi:hypothetical protein
MANARRGSLALSRDIGQLQMRIRGRYKFNTVRIGYISIK